MSFEFILGTARESILTVLSLAGPLLAISLLIGLCVSIFQATTQIQEPTLTYVPKIIAVFIGILLFGSWMLTTLVNYTVNLYAQLGKFGM
jgi:flagellar biosynthetic protein FliQ